MDHTTARSLIQSDAISKGATWADLDAGEGTFTRALAELIGSNGEIYAVDKEPQLPSFAKDNQSLAKIHHIQADFTQKLDLPQLGGILMANSLHYVPSPIIFLSKVLTFLKPKGKFILIEYDRRTANPWVPYPIPQTAWQEIAMQVGLSSPVLLGEHNSKYGNGVIYSAISEI